MLSCFADCELKREWPDELRVQAFLSLFRIGDARARPNTQGFFQQRSEPLELLEVAELFIA